MGRAGRVGPGWAGHVREAVFHGDGVDAFVDLVVVGAAEQGEVPETLQVGNSPSSGCRSLIRPKVQRTSEAGVSGPCGWGLD